MIVKYLFVFLRNLYQNDSSTVILVLTNAMLHMNRLVFFSVIFLFTSIGCSNDDDTTSDPDINTSELNGTWNLVNVNGGFVGIDHDFSTGTIVWVFNDTNTTVTITNNNTDDAIEDLLPTGTYDYTVVTIGDNLELIVDSVNRGNFEITMNQFTIVEQPRDGFRFTFGR